MRSVFTLLAVFIIETIAKVYYQGTSGPSISKFSHALIADNKPA
jgi:hypothetical protein